LTTAAEQSTVTGEGSRPAGPPGAGQLRFFVTCARGTEGALRREIAALRIAGARGDAGGVWFDGPMEMGMRVCLHARVAMRVLVELGRWSAPDAAALYAGARALDWRAWLDAQRTIAVFADVSDTPELTHSGFAALKVKDGIVDALRDALGARPDVNARDPDVSVRLHLQAGEAKVFLDLAGEPLHRRGYRVAMTDAPLKESLAAAILTLGRVDPALPFWDPMGGSGTLPIEHALMARQIAPGLGRAFGFQRWPGYAGTTWERDFRRLVDEARGRILPAAPAPILCTDRFGPALEAARQNAAAAGVAGDLVFEQADVREARPRFSSAGNLVLNPPYGERMMPDVGAAAATGRLFAPPRPQPGAPGSGRARFSTSISTSTTPAPAVGRPPPGRLRVNFADATEAEREAEIQRLKLVGLYRGMAEAFRRFTGWGIVVLSGSASWAEPVPWRPLITHKLFNGPLEVRLLRYEMPADGSAPPSRSPPPSGPAGRTASRSANRPGGRRE
jgi:putative N6-adenine-specific DNA methylase